MTQLLPWNPGAEMRPCGLRRIEVIYGWESLLWGEGKKRIKKRLIFQLSTPPVSSGRHFLHPSTVPWLPVHTCDSSDGSSCRHLLNKWSYSLHFQFTKPWKRTGQYIESQCVNILLLKQCSPLQCCRNFDIKVFVELKMTRCSCMTPAGRVAVPDLWR